MSRTSVLVSALTLVVVLLAAGAGGVAAQETGPDTETAETAVVAQQQQQFVEAEIIVENRSGDEERLSGIQVTAEWGDNESTSDSTTSAGRALLDVPADTEVAFSVNDSGGEFVRNLQPVRVEPGELDEPITIQMAPRGQVAFSVMDTNDEPVEEARLRLTHDGDDRAVDIVFTDEDGTATVDGIEQRSYDVSIFRSGYNTAEQTINVTGPEEVEEFEIQSNRVDVNFRVLDSHFEEPQPLEGATLDIEGVGRPIPTDENGETQARIPVNNGYEVTVLLDGYQERTTTLTIEEEATSVEIRTRRSPSISINQLQDAIVVGQPTQVTITNAYDEPVENAMVSLNDETVGQTDAQGQVVFNITQAGNNVIDASYQGLTDSTTLNGVDPDQEPATDNTDDDSNADNTSDSDDSEETTDDDAIGPGFGIVAALGAVIGIALIAARRRS